MNRAVAVILLFAAVAATSPRDWRAIDDSLMSIRSGMRPRWLETRGLYHDYCTQHSWRPDSQGLRCVGRWSFGPSYKVSVHADASDTLVLLTRGSGATIARFRSHDSVVLQPLGEIDCSGIPHRAILVDSLVVVGIERGGTGLEVFDVGDLSAPRRLARIDLPTVNDVAVSDSLVYLACADDSLRVYSVANPVAPVRLGACCDTSDLAMCYAGGYCYLVDASGIHIDDVTDPTNPHRAGRIGGHAPLAVAVRDSLLYMTTESEGFLVFNVADPGTPFPVGSLAGDSSMDLYLPPTCDTVAYTSALRIISIADPAHPRYIGTVASPGWDGGVSAAPALNYAFIADHFDGVVAVNITNPAAPVVDTAALAGGLAEDVYVDGSKLYVASSYSGLAVLDATDPTLPKTLGVYDSLGQWPTMMAAVAGRDSFAYIAWPQPRVLSVDVTDPSHPVRTAGCAGMFNQPEDMVLRDSFLYCAEANRFQVVNVAHPRAPVLVGSCVSTDGNYFGLAVQDTFAYEVSFNGMWIVNIARPDSPTVVSSNVGRNATGIAVRDTFVYIPAAYDTLWVYSVANPALPTLLGTTPARHGGADIALADSVAVTGSATGLELFSLVDPAHPLRLGAVSTPYAVRRVVYSAPYFYVAMYDAGVAVYETTATGIAEANAGNRNVNTTAFAYPNPTRGLVGVRGFDRNAAAVVVSDVTGRVVLHLALTRRSAAGPVVLDLRDLKAGVYFVELRKEGRDPNTIVRLVKL
jgi:hypothetical protein